ncbi:hypothetical protein GQ53DRAFT_52852 [Thozetella sp. PMI_491]|nr:hypothetical protein GQ53DRAFT_52852 [Thozetella sp. PMI_491]
MASREDRGLDLLALLTSLPEAQEISCKPWTGRDSFPRFVTKLSHVAGAPDGRGSPSPKPLVQGGTPPVVSVTAIDDPITPPPRTEEPLAAPPATFTYFPRLPAELRLQIWALSFEPRTIELHTRRTHYADSDRHGGGVTRWLSLSRNPAALSVNAEARAAALEHYTVAMPLFLLTGDQTSERPGDLLGGSDRLLYMNLETDTLAVLGDPPFERLTRLLDWFRRRDEVVSWPTAGRRLSGGDPDRSPKGLRRLALSVAPWLHAAGSATLRVFARTVFADLEEFSMFMYAERVPPPNWGGGKVLLEDCGASDASDHYRRFVLSRGMQFREENGWMKVGMNQLKVMDISFDGSW